MKAYLIWDERCEKPALWFLMKTNAPHIQYTEGNGLLNDELRHVSDDRPDIIFYSFDSYRPESHAMLRQIRLLDPGCFLITVEKSSRQEREPKTFAETSVALPWRFTEKQVLDAVFRAELSLTGVSQTSQPAEEEEEPILIEPSDFLDELDMGLFGFPEEICERHWEAIETMIRQNPEAAGWYMVTMANQMMTRLKEAGHVSDEMEKTHTEFLRLLSRGFSASTWRSSYDNFCKAYVQEKLDLTDSSGHELISIKNYIIDHVEEDVSLKHVASAFYLSTAYLSRLFKSKTGSNFSDFVAEVKIKRAKTLLTETDQTIAEISQRLGYSEQNSFSRFFKGKTGMSPQNYRTVAASNGQNAARAQRPGAEPVLEDFEITDFGPCAFVTTNNTYSYSFHRRV